MSFKSSEWPVKKVSLSPPSLSELAPVILSGLKSNFKSVEIEVSECPDLRQSPFHLAAAGLCGNSCISDVGGQANLLPEPNRSKKYDLLSVAQMMNMKSNQGMLIGAGAGPFHLLGINSELMPNLAYQQDNVNNLTHYAMVQDDGNAKCEKVGNTDFSLMGNFFGCDGQRGPALHIKAKSRTGQLNFTESIQEALKSEYGTKLISMGGVFVITGGKSNLHIMPDFPKEPFGGREAVEKWLKYFDVDGPLSCLTVFHSGDDQGMKLRAEHTHCFSVDQSGRGGHYHYDLDDTKENIEYEAWLNTAEVLYRIDQP